jgi:hypothetical protein
MAVRDQRKPRIGISTAFAKRLHYTAEGEPVVQNNGAVQIAAGKELDFGCAPTPGRVSRLGAGDHLKLGG